MKLLQQFTARYLSRGQDRQLYQNKQEIEQSILLIDLIYFWRSLVKTANHKICLKKILKIVMLPQAEVANIRGAFVLLCC